MRDVIAAVATGRVPCAIGILRLSGDGCAQIADKDHHVIRSRDSQAPTRWYEIFESRTKEIE